MSDEGAISGYFQKITTKFYGEVKYLRYYKVIMSDGGHIIQYSDYTDPKK